jgi:hypothetical protein
LVVPCPLVLVFVSVFACFFIRLIHS